jgi:hypothetical protein
VTARDALRAAAREIDCPVSDLCTAEDNCTRRPLAAALRALAARLDAEVELTLSLDDLGCCDEADKEGRQMLLARLDADLPVKPDPQQKDHQGGMSK